MPFAALPSSPGFIPPAAPDWGQFAALAIQQIQHGGDIRAEAGKDLVAGIDKSVAQISSIMKYNSPLEKAKRRMEMLQTQAMTDVWNDFHAHPEKYQMTAHGPILKDPFTQMLRVTQYHNAQTTGAINDLNLQRGQKSAQLSQGLDDFRKTYSNYDSSKLSTAPADANVPPGTQGSTSSTTAAPDPGSDMIPVAQDYTNWPAGTTPDEVFPNEVSKPIPDNVISDPNDPRLQQ